MLGPEPATPLHPFLTAADPTIEGLVKAWRRSSCARHLHDRGRAILGGYGMARTTASRRRRHIPRFGTGSRSSGSGQPMASASSRPRLSMHLMIQPDAAAGFFRMPMLRDQGLLSRMLVAAPDSLAGTRLYRDTEPADEAAIKAYGARMLSLLEAPWPLAKGKANELDPRPLSMSADCAAAWRAFFDHVEGQSRARPGSGRHPGLRRESGRARRAHCRRADGG